MFVDPVILNMLFRFVVSENLTLSGTESYCLYMLHRVLWTQALLETTGAVYTDSGLVSTVWEDQQSEESSASLR